ncbi:CAAX protease [Bacillus sp. FJAT-27225]|uniref:CPBP family intramembrane glutamic endopeptidase n=1 Tax=Bacillus sp. FJAT-27225 TaxID=1743144 RepID=UPI00080C2BC9|nr:CPBP family intramembrane glutamic endopeptidase [Bacillus sp. FJAT-27225]OCA85628.1 CAAX protease [Bacillus sp. FJAT-27225]
MPLEKIDFRLLTGFLLAHLLLFFTFQDRDIFWYIFSASLLFLTIWTIWQEDVDDSISFSEYMGYGLISGFALFGLFYVGDMLFDILGLPFRDNISKLYSWFAPKQFWHYIALILIAAPGEELFWRGYVQKRLLKSISPLASIFVSSIMYASVHIYSNEFILVFAAFVSGLAWGLLYAWKRSMPLVIVSHLVFDLMLFVFLPLN